jgi:hypothetical protein
VLSIKYKKAKANGTTINALLVLAYGREGAVNVKTFNQWKQEGKRVKKEVKALFYGAE